MGKLIKADTRDLAAESRQYLTFTLGGEQFAVGTLCVKEIIEYGQVTAIPMMPPSIRGVINLRGAVVPVIDLDARFGGPVTAVGRRTCIVILEVQHAEGRQVLGVVVDAVNEVLEIAPADIEPPPAFLMPGTTDWMAKYWWRRLTAMRSSQNSGVTSSSLWRSSRAALLTSTVMVPSSAAVSAMTAW